MICVGVSDVSARFAGRIAARICRGALKLALTGDWIRVERVPGTVDSLWLRALGGVQGGAMYGFARGRESFSRSIWRRAFSDDALDILPGMAGSGVRRFDCSL